VGYKIKAFDKVIVTTYTNPKQGVITKKNSQGSYVKYTKPIKMHLFDNKYLTISGEWKYNKHLIPIFMYKEV